MKVLKKIADYDENLWLSSTQQTIRFEITNKFLIDGETLIDVGCGTLDLPKYLLSKGRIFNYLGIDSNPDLIVKNRNVPLQVIYTDIIKENIPLPKGNIVVAWGVTAYFDSYKQMRKYDVMQIFISKLLSMSNRIVLFDIWDENRFFHKSGVDDEGISYFEPQKVINIIQSIAPSVQTIIKLPMDKKDPEADLFILNLR